MTGTVRGRGVDISGLAEDVPRAAPAYANLLAAAPELWQARLRRASGVGKDKKRGEGRRRGERKSPLVPLFQRGRLGRGGY